MAEETRGSGFEVDGERFSIPTLDTVTIDEERLLFIWADVVVSDFVDAHPDWSDDEKWAHERGQMTRVRNPDFKRTLAVIAYRRAHPDTPVEEAMALLGGLGAIELDVAMVTPDLEEDLEGDPTTTPPSPSGPEKTPELSEPASNTVFGLHTERSSGPQDSSPPDIGTGGSETSSQELRPTGSES